MGLAALAIIAAGIGGYLVAGNGGGGGGGGETVPVVAQQGIGGTLAVGDTSSMLDLHGLGGLSGREVYQVWVAHGLERAALVQLHPRRAPAARRPRSTAISPRGRR